MNAATDITKIFVELGASVLLLALLARLASRWGFSAIPLYLLAGLAFGNGGLAPLDVSESFIHTGSEIGVLLLLFMLGLEYTGDELKKSLAAGFPAGVMDFALNFPPGVVYGLILGWKPVPAVLLGGVTYISSSGVIAKLLNELGWKDNPETPTVLSILVMEDLVMAIYLPLVAVFVAGGGPQKILISVLVAGGAVCLVLIAAVRYGARLSRLMTHESDEALLLTTFGLVLLVAGVVQRFQVSAAIGAFLVGIAVSGPIAERSHHLLSPLRDLFAAIFFFFFGMEIDPRTLPSALPLAVGLAVITAGTKILTGIWSARRAGLDQSGRRRAGFALVARGEFSIVIAGLGVAVEPALGPLAAAYVLLLAALGPILARFAK